MENAALRSAYVWNPRIRATKWRGCGNRRCFVGAFPRNEIGRSYAYFRGSFILTRTGGAFFDFTGESFFEAAKILVAAHVPVILVEGVVYNYCLAFFMKVMAELLGVTHATG